MRIVGLKIEKGKAAVSVIDKGMRQTELRESYGLSFATDTELADILREKAREWTGARIVSSIPGGQFSQRMLTFPFSDRKRVEKAIPFELEDVVPFSLDDVEIDHVPLERDGKGAESKKETDVLAFMLPKAVLRNHLELLAAAGIDPQAVVPSCLGLAHLAKMIAVEGLAVLIDGSDLCIKEGKNIHACRSISGATAAGGIRHTLKAMETERGERIEKVYLLSEQEDLRTELAALGIGVERVVPEYAGKKPADPVSLGLALTEQVNFRKGEFAFRLADVGARKRMRTLIIAGAFAALFVGTNIGVKSYLVESRYGKLDREIKDVFRQTLPDSKAVGDPVRQLRSKLDDAQKQFGVYSTGTSALDVMKAVTEGIPKEVRVSFQDFLLDGGKLKLQGEAASFESLDKIKAELQKSGAFAEVAIQDTRMGVDNKVKFRLELKLKQ